MKATAVLENWAIFADVAYGNIYGDENRRWPDGQEIRTSTIREVVGEEYIVTQNSIYKLGKPAKYVVQQ